MKRISDSTLIICSIVRNAEKGLRRNIPIINSLCRKFNDFTIVIYENDSIDNTKQILHAWQQSMPQKIHVISEDTDSSKTIPTSEEVSGVNPFFSRKRIAKMANLRNKYLTYLEENSLKSDFIMVVDLDVASLCLDGILDSFEKSDRWDIVTAYGYSTGPNLRRRYHDTYALTKLNTSDRPQTESDIITNASEMARICKSSSNLIPVDSAFGGLAIYKFKAIQGLRYQVEPNNDSRVEVHCEHFSLNRQAAKKGFNRIFINPLMILKYQKITLRFILEKLSQKILLH